MSKCLVCNDNKFIERGGVVRECPCQTKKAVKAFLPPMFSKYPLAKKFDYKKFDTDLLYRTTLSKFGSFANTFLTHKFLVNRKFRYEITTAYGFVEAFFEGDSLRFYEEELLIMMLYGGYKNKASPDRMITLMKDRALMNRKTIVFVDSTDHPDTKIQDWYGKEFLDHINQFTKIGG